MIRLVGKSGFDCSNLVQIICTYSLHVLRLLYFNNVNEQTILICSYIIDVDSDVRHNSEVMHILITPGPTESSSIGFTKFHCFVSN